VYPYGRAGGVTVKGEPDADTTCRARWSPALDSILYAALSVAHFLQDCRVPVSPLNSDYSQQPHLEAGVALWGTLQVFRYIERKDETKVHEWAAAPGAVLIVSYVRPAAPMLCPPLLLCLRCLLSESIWMRLSHYVALLAFV